MPKIRLTHKSVDTARVPSQGRIEYWDTALPAFGLRVTSNGVKSWVLMYRNGTRLRRLTVGRYPSIGLADAREKARAAIQLRDQGVDPGTQKTAARTAETFEGLAREFLERYAKLHNRRWQETQRIIDHELLPRWNGLRVSAIQRRDVIALLDDIVARGSPIMANGTLAVVRKMYNWAISRDIVPNSPCHGVTPPGKSKTRERVLSDDEIRQLWARLDHARITPGIRDGIRLQLATAQRIGEVMSMRWSDVDTTDGMWTIPATHSKNRRSHRVPLSSLAQKTIEAQPRHEHTDWIFPSPRAGGSVGADAPAHALHKNRNIIEIEDLRPHDLRRTAASKMASLGISRLVLSKILNHTDSTVTAVYDRHSYDAEKREALERWAGYLSDLLARDTTN